MKQFLDGIRRKRQAALYRQITGTIAILLLGAALGVFSKFLDSTASNELPRILEYLDLRNVLGRFAIWLLLALCIAVYSCSPVRAALNVFVFFAGMVASYYLYSELAAGFFPKSYALVWAGFTVLSPLLAFICWYAKGTGKLALGISSLVIAVLFNASFYYGWLYFNVRSVPELLTFLCGAAVLRRHSAKDTAVMLAAGVAVALLLDLIVSFRFG